MGAADIEIGKKYGCLTVLYEGPENGAYHCRCDKCGKTKSYTGSTLLKEPKYCYRPVYCSTKFTYSIKANNANYRKRMEYTGDESVQLVSSKEDVVPGDDYCAAWNKKRAGELAKQAEKETAALDRVPREFARNYDIDFTGKRYESLVVLECVNDHLESEPACYFNQRHQKKYRNITVFRKYRCRCSLCGKEMTVTCDRFGIYPPTEYGYRAFDGYWSEVFCDCHPVSSFQWIVTDILIKNNVDYRVEATADGLYGIDGKTPLRYDFAVYRDGKICAYIECQGEQHYMPVEEFGGKKRFAIQQENDAKKREYAEKNGISLIEISYQSKRYETIEKTLRENGII